MQLGVSTLQLREELVPCFEAVTQSMSADVRAAMDVGAARCESCTFLLATLVAVGPCDRPHQSCMVGGV
jgi:hypothetical protein